MRRVRWAAILGTVLIVLAYVSLWSGWDDNWTLTLGLGGVYLLLLEIVRD